MWSVNDRPWPFEQRSGNELEESVANWMAGQAATAWISSTVVLGTLLIAMVLFAISR